MTVQDMFLNEEVSVACLYCTLCTCIICTHVSNYPGLWFPV